MEYSNLSAIDVKHIWHPFTPFYDKDQIMIEKGKGAYIITPHGDAIIDAISSWWVNIHGHGNETLAKAIYDQAMKLEQVIFAGFTHKPAIELTNNLLKILPENQQKVFFSDDGSTAVEVGIKLALQYWYNQGKPRTGIIALDGAYHGDTFGSMSVGGKSVFNKPFDPLLFDVDFIPLPNHDNANEVIEKFTNFISSGEIAAFIFEPIIQGAGGMRIYPAEVLNKLVDIAQSNGVICIADEVMTGFFRTGKMFASNHLSHNPDIFCLSKGITGGTLPLGVTTCSEKVASAFELEDFTKAFFHGHSYTANPLACAASNASMQILLSEDCQQRIQNIVTLHADFMHSTKGHKRIKTIHQTGTILAIELISEKETSYVNTDRKKIYNFFLERNILLRPLGNVIYIMPPYVIQDHELHMVYDAIQEFLDVG